MEGMEADMQELSQVITEEYKEILECQKLLKKFSTMEIEERSLRIELIQLLENKI